MSETMGMKNINIIKKYIIKIQNKTKGKRKIESIFIRENRETIINYVVRKKEIKEQRKWIT